jgi:beta-fructofuranosidase
MRKVVCLTGFILASVLCCPRVLGTREELVAWWRFEEGEVKKAHETISGIEDEIRGNFKFVGGSSGSALKFDGFTTSVVRKAEQAPKLGDAFTIEAWIALGAYPWNWCPIVSQADFGESGYYFGIDSQGRFGLSVKTGGEWLSCKSEIPVERQRQVGPKIGLDLRTWYHLAGVYDSKSGITIYVDGKIAGTLVASGKVEFAPEMDVLLGRNHKKMVPTHPVRAFATHPSWYSFDGIIDDIKI